MIRRLILLRHAKSAWDDVTLDDKARPLNARGRRDAPRMGAWLASQNIKPDLVLVSTAVRTRETWLLFSPALSAGDRGAPKELLRDDLYHAEAQRIVDVVRATDAAVSTLLLIGHNSGMEEAAALLVGRGKDAVRKAMAAKFPTAALAIITFEVGSWRDIAAGTGYLDAFVTPKSLA